MSDSLIALALASPTELEAINRELQGQILERQRADAELRRAHDEHGKLVAKIANRQQAEGALLESEKRSRSLFEDSPLPM